MLATHPVVVVGHTIVVTAVVGSFLVARHTVVGWLLLAGHHGVALEVQITSVITRSHDL